MLSNGRALPCGVLYLVYWDVWLVGYFATDKYMIVMVPLHYE